MRNYIQLIAIIIINYLSMQNICLYHILYMHLIE